MKKREFVKLVVGDIVQYKKPVTFFTATQPQVPQVAQVTRTVNAKTLEFIEIDGQGDAELLDRHEILAWWPDPANTARTRDWLEGAI